MYIFISYMSLNIVVDFIQIKHVCVCMPEKERNEAERGGMGM